MFKSVSITRWDVAHAHTLSGAQTGKLADGNEIIFRGRQKRMSCPSEAKVEGPNVMLCTIA